MTTHAWAARFRVVSLERWALQNARLLEIGAARRKLGQRITPTHWLRGEKVYGHPMRGFVPGQDSFVARVYWPLSDPHPTRRWW